MTFNFIIPKYKSTGIITNCFKFKLFHDVFVLLIGNFCICQVLCRLTRFWFLVIILMVFSDDGKLSLQTLPLLFRFLSLKLL